MRISFVIPEKGVFTGGKNWLWWVYLELRKKTDVLLNNCDKFCDFIVGMTDSVRDRIWNFHYSFPSIPLVLYNWDWFSFKEYPSDWKELLKMAKDVWTCSKDTAEICQKALGISHYVIYCPAIPDEFKGKKSDDGFCLMASRRDFYKGWEIFERGCRELNLPFVSCHPNIYSREEFIKKMKSCSLVVVASYEESNATMSSIEGAFCKKPLLLSDITANKECWGDCAFYFKNKDLEDFKNKISWLYENRFSSEVKEKVECAYRKAKKEYTPRAMANAILKRLYEIRKV